MSDRTFDRREDPHDIRDRVYDPYTLNDTLNDTLRRILGRKPKKPFTAKELKY